MTLFRQFQDLIAAQMKSNHLDTEVQWRVGIQRLGVGPVSEFRREKEREMIIQRVQQTEMIDRVPVSDADTLAFYRQRNGPSDVAPSAEVLADIKRTVPTDARQRAWNEFVRRLRAQATVEWPIATVKRAYDDGLAQMATQNPR